ncbi:Dabb family protein [Parahaliea aestuarii]|nr:Dabb family protein [Parahaliea aestuarii]
MITVMDRIVVAPADAHRVEQLLEGQYRQQAGQRGLHFQSLQYSPPLLTADSPLTLWVQWQVESPEAWWVMRAQSATAEVAAFWQALDQLCLSRERTYLMQDSAGNLPAVAEPIDRPASVRGYRETAQLALIDDPGAGAELEALLNELTAGLPGLQASHLLRNLAPEYAAGHYTWDLYYTDARAAAEAQASPAWQGGIAPALERLCGAVHAQRLDSLGAGLRDPLLQGGVKRTAFFRLLPGVDADRAGRFERDLLEMPRHIAAIRNWRLSRASAVHWHRADCAPWTYVWEQDFADLEGLTGPYMTHPHHWAHVDRWFDPESGAQALDVQLSHAFGFFASSALAAELHND